MAISVYFNPESLDAATYDAIIKDLEAAGAGHPAGRRFHACFGDGSKLQVFDVWDSREAFDEFGKTLMPLLQAKGINVGEPMFDEVHNIIT